VKYLYLHGFGSSPLAKKAVAFADYFAPKGIVFERPDLRVPTFERMTLSAMIDTVRARIAGEDTIIVGSSLGGLTASRVAEREPHVRGLVLLAPAFQLAARWRTTLGAAYDDWARTGWRDVTMTTGEPAKLHFEFMTDLAAIDVGFPAIAVPTLIFHGTRDDAVPIEHSRRFVATCPSARLVEVDDTHELMASLPTMLAETERHFGGIQM
jgi:hypothetical protein